MASWQLAEQVALAAEACLAAWLDDHVAGEGVAPPPAFIAQCRASRARAWQALARLPERNRRLQQALPLL